MECPQCQTSNEDGAQRCAGCGVLFALITEGSLPPVPPSKPVWNRLALSGLLLVIAAPLWYCLGLLTDINIAHRFVFRSVVVLGAGGALFGIVGYWWARTAAVPVIGTNRFGLPAILLGFVMLGWGYLAIQISGQYQPHSCMVNQRQLAQVILMYRMEHEDRFPGDLQSVTRSLSHNSLICPDNNPSFPWSPRAEQHGYGYNARLAGLKYDTITNQQTCLLLADSVTPNSMMTGPRDLATRRHNGDYVVTFCDGHCEVKPVAYQFDPEFSPPARRR